MGLGSSVQFQLDLSSWSFYSLRDREDGGVFARRGDTDVQRHRGFVGSGLEGTWISGDDLGNNSVHVMDLLRVIEILDNKSLGSIDGRH